MAGGAGVVTRLLLLSFIGTGVNGDDCLICAERGYNIAFPCGGNVCVHLWHFSRREASDYVALVSNGEIQTSKLLDDGSKCSLPIEDLTAEDVGRHRCQQRPGAPALNLMPGKTLSLQCVLLDSSERGQCSTAPQRGISLTWVDETDAEVQEDSEHQIKRRSPCDVTLTLTRLSAPSKRLRCQMTNGGRVQTSEELWVRSTGPRGRRGGFMVERDQTVSGGRQNVIGVGVGVVGCVALAVLLVAAAVSRRQANRPPPEESLNTVSANNAVNADDVIYADIIFPVGRQAAWVPECEPTEYACVRY
ncbi:uncharacterized protein LOC115401975 [Salarias fasciatus]|uniref:uncharacterized protein LOC115401975 n=1 Tax=Salarias fasciatus TaxID=181472 RepID=UPI001176CC0A|nr:uncharacterized protein LOC115401975 [Salarias fasciatus]